MDKLEIGLSYSEYQKGNIVEFIVNGRNLIDILFEIELPYAELEGHPSIAGDYMGIEEKYILFPSKHIFGESEEIFVNTEGKVSLLECSCCGCAGCWSFEMKIEVLNDKVVWSEFGQAHRSSEEWSYKELKPLIFDRKEYEREWRKYESNNEKDDI